MEREGGGGVGGLGRCDDGLRVAVDEVLGYALTSEVAEGFEYYLDVRLSGCFYLRAVSLHPTRRYSSGSARGGGYTGKETRYGGTHLTRPILTSFVVLRITVDLSTSVTCMVLR